MLQIERNFLQQRAEALQLNEIKLLQRALVNGAKKRFETSLALSEKVKFVYEWFNNQGKEELSTEGIEWTIEDLSMKVFNFQKSFFHKLNRAAVVPVEVKERYISECDRVRAEGRDVNMSIENLLKFAKQVESESTAEGGNGEEGGEGSEDGQQVSVEQPSVKCTFSYKLDTGNISFRILTDGTIKTTNSKAQIVENLLDILDFINNSAL